MNFNSHTDVVVRVAVDLVNLLTPGEERGRRYAPPEAGERTAAVGAVLRGAGGREATWEEAASLCFVAAELRGVFEAVSTGAVDDAARQVNALLIRTGGTARPRARIGSRRPRSGRACHEPRKCHTPLVMCRP